MLVHWKLRDGVSPSVCRASGRKISVSPMFAIQAQGTVTVTIQLNSAFAWLLGVAFGCKVNGDYSLTIAINSSSSVNNRTRSAAECHLYWLPLPSQGVNTKRKWWWHGTPWDCHSSISLEGAWKIAWSMMVGFDDGHWQAFLLYLL